MIRTVAIRLIPTFSFPIFFENHNNNDIVHTAPIPEPSNGWERIKRMYSTTEMHEPSVEMLVVGQSAMTGAFIGACMGGFVKSKDAYLYFIENNQASIFKSTLEAKKKLQDYVTVAFAKGAYRWGWRLGLFTGMFSLISTTISVYRDDTSLTQFVAAGTLTGGIYRLNLGLAATCVGAGLGAVLSSVGGMAILGLLKVTGISMNDISMALKSLADSRSEQMSQAEEKTAKIKNDALTIHHNEIVKNKGELTIQELK